MSYDYNQIIEYIDGTLDENFNNARKWARRHGTSFNELMERRDLPKRYFQIGPEPVPYVPTEDEKKEQVRAIRNNMLQATDWTQLADAPVDETERGYYVEYRQYLRDYTEEENWWERLPDTFEEWLLTHHPVVEENTNITEE